MLLDIGSNSYMCGILFKERSHYDVFTSPDTSFNINNYIQFGTFSTNGLGFRTVQEGVTYTLTVRRLL